MECWKESLKLLSVAEAAVECNKLNAASQDLGHDSDDFVVRRRFTFYMFSSFWMLFCQIIASNKHEYLYSSSYVLFPL